MTFTIDTDNNITAHGTPEEAAAATTTPFDSFSSQEELAELIANWPAERLVATWNSLPGVTPVKRFKGNAAAASRIWERIQRLGEPASTEAEPTKRKPERKAKGGARAPKSAPRKAKSEKKATPAKKPAKAPTKAKGAKSESGREGSKTAAVIAMLERKGGATLAEIMKATGWQAHSVRGFISGTLGKKMDLAVRSAKRDDGTRFYSIAK